MLAAIHPKEKLFLRGDCATQSRMAIAFGAFLNAIGILLGALFGLTQRAPLSAHTQDFFRRALGAAAVFFGLRLVWLHVNGTFRSCAKQIFIALLAVTLGHWIGKLLRLQKISNRLGRFAGNLLAAAQKNPPKKSADGFFACTILFCVAPLGIATGAVTDGLSGDFYLLAVKAFMWMDAGHDGFYENVWLASRARGVSGLFFLGALTLAAQILREASFLDAHNLIDSINVAGGFVLSAPWRW